MEEKNSELPKLKEEKSAEKTDIGNINIDANEERKDELSIEKDDAYFIDNFNKKKGEQKDIENKDLVENISKETIKEKESNNGEMIISIIIALGIIELVATELYFGFQLDDSSKYNLIYGLIPSVFGVFLPLLVAKEGKKEVKKAYLVIMLLIHYGSLGIGIDSVMSTQNCVGLSCLSVLGIVFPLYLSGPIFLIGTIIFLVVNSLTNSDKEEKKNPNL